MAVVVKCKSCGVRARAKDRLAGKCVRCKCGAVLEIPREAPLDDVADLSVLEGLEGGESAGESEPRCPGCLALMPDGAVLCTECGYNKETGQRLSVSIDDGAKPPPSPSEVIEARTKSQLREDRTSQTVQIVVKLLVIAFVVGGVAGVGWMIKTSLAFDPKQQAADASAKIFPGMTVAQAVDAIGSAPSNVVVFEDRKQPGPLGRWITVERLIPYQQDFMHVVDYQLLQYGFSFVYQFSQRDELHIYFSDEGKLDRARLVDPMAHLLQR